MFYSEEKQIASKTEFTKAKYGRQLQALVTQKIVFMLFYDKTLHCMIKYIVRQKCT